MEMHQGSFRNILGGSGEMAMMDGRSTLSQVLHANFTSYLYVGGQNINEIPLQ